LPPFSIVHLDPRFAPDGYHILPGSGASDRGGEAGVAVDIDGNPQPSGATLDLGADELMQLFLPLIRR
jgi:hypothetical protein